MNNPTERISVAELVTMPDWQQRRLNKALNKIVPVELAPPIAGQTWVEHLAKSSPAETCQFWDWHDAYVSDLNNDPAAQKAIMANNAAFDKELKRAVVKRALPAHMLDAHMENPRPEVKIGSPLELCAKGRYGFYNPNSNTITVEEKIRWGTYSHERFHAIGHIEGTNLDEAMTTYAAKTLLCRQRTPLKAVEAGRFDGYEENLKQVDIIASEGKWPIALGDFVSAYAGPETSSAQIDHLHEQIALSFDGHDPLTFVEKTVKKQQDRIAEAEPTISDHESYAAARQYTTYAVKALALHVTNRSIDVYDKQLALKALKLKAESAALQGTGLVRLFGGLDYDLDAQTINRFRKDLQSGEILDAGLST